MASSDRWITRANLLTLLRLLLAPVLVVEIAHDRAAAATLVFFLAVATDFADGWVARRYGEQSPLGGLVDHAVDASFVTAGTAALAWQGVLPAALPALVSAAFLQYAVDSRLAGGRALRGSPLGRWNGIAYYVIVAVPIVRDALALGWPGPGLVTALGWVLVASTLISMADRLRQLRTASAARRAPGSPGAGRAGRWPR
jgi:phosphatidylglycerophosphate synthase